VLVFYGYICGFSASVTRAIFLCLITYACALFGITSDFLDSLGVALFFVLVYSPTLLFEVGCLLSFSACFGIALLSRRINRVLEGAGTRLRKIFVRESPQTNGWLPPEDDPPTVIEYFIKRLNALISVSLAAQLATAPVQLYFFGYVSLAGLAFNLIFVPIVGMCFGGLLCLTAIACCLPVLSGFLLYAPSVVWLGLTLVFEIMDFSTYALTCEYVPFGSVLAYYTTLVLLSDKINLKGLRIFYVLAGLACAAVGFLAGMA
jgi:competence protein ComEC